MSNPEIPCPPTKNDLKRKFTLLRKNIYNAKLMAKDIVSSSEIFTEDIPKESQVAFKSYMFVVTDLLERSLKYYMDASLHLMYKNYQKSIEDRENG